MRPIRTIALMTALAVTLAACGSIRESRLNPFNWFGRGEETTTVAQEAPPSDPRLLVQSVTDLKIDRTPEGAIVTATGLPPTQGWWDAELVEEPAEEGAEGTLTYRFVVFPPPGQRRVSTPQSREVTAGAFISNIRLETIGTIMVAGETNSRTSRR